MRHGEVTERGQGLDCIVDDALWMPKAWKGAQALHEWGPTPPPSSLAPDDLAALMAGGHTS